MNIIQKETKTLKFADYNPRQLTKEQHKSLKDSITEFGLVDPVIVNKNKKRLNVIIGGHQRVKVAKELGIKKVPCVLLDLTLEKEKELNVRLNKNTGGWDYDVLANEFDMKELVDWGFSEKNLFGLYDEVDYSILEDDDVDTNMVTLKDSTRKAIQIEFKLEDYEEALQLFKVLREEYEYIGGEILNFLKSKVHIIAIDPEDKLLN